MVFIETSELPRAIRDKEAELAAAVDAKDRDRATLLIAEIEALEVKLQEQSTATRISVSDIRSELKALASTASDNVLTLRGDIAASVVSHAAHCTSVLPVLSSPGRYAHRAAYWAELLQR